jgi:transposase
MYRNGGISESGSVVFAIFATVEVCPASGFFWGWNRQPPVRASSRRPTIWDATATVVASVGCQIGGTARMLRRHEICDDHWDVIKDLLPGKEGDPGVTAQDNRLFVNAVLWIAKTGAPWRDLPNRFGRWNSVFQRFNRWCKAGVWQTILEQLQDPDLEVLLLDSTIIRAHQHAAGAEGSTAEAEALGRSRGGFSTKIHVACDGLGKPVKLILTPGQDHDVTQGPALIAESDAAKMIADKAYDSDEFIETIESKPAEAVIPPRRNRTEERHYDKQEYKKRNVVERFINTIKQCRRVATRYEKTARNFLAFVQFASIFVLLN